MTRSAALSVVLGIATAIVAGIACVSARSHGTDFLDMMLGGTRFLAGTPLYEGSGPAYGMVGPPVLGLVMAPFAWVATINVDAARALWAIVNLVAGWIGLRAWSRALGVAPGSVAVSAAAAAVAFPLYREIQSQNITLLLFACTGLSAAASRVGDGVRTGAWIGVATAVKLFPGLAIVYLAARGRWRAAVSAAVVTVAVSLLPVARYGVGGYIELWRAWIFTRTHGDFPTWTHNQALAVALNGRVPAVVVAAVLLLVAAGLLGLAWHRRALSDERVPEELALTLAVAVVLSPIAWIPYWVLTFPVLLVLAGRALLGERPAIVVFVIAAMLISVVPVWRRDTPGYELLYAAVVVIAVVFAELLQNGARVYSPRRPQ